MAHLLGYGSEDGVNLARDLLAQTGITPGPALERLLGPRASLVDASGATRGALEEMLRAARLEAEEAAAAAPQP